ncbi:MAG: IS4 family transposase [Gammaproteobacteria bacterium]|nr:IS4 family transposase [Gammaproteobacteria bacterium]
MRHYNSLFHDVLQFVPWSRFERLVEEHGADFRVRRLSTRSQFIAMLFAQLAGSQSLRDVETVLGSQRDRLYHLGAAAPARSTLADANARRPAAMFGALFGLLLKQARPGLRRKFREAVNLIDATSIRLGTLSGGWAEYEAHGVIAKMHVVLDADSGRPVHFTVTPARVNDITEARKLPVQSGETYVFDLGYYDFQWWRSLHDAGCRLVTRIKRNTRPHVLEERAVPAGGTVMADRIVQLEHRMTGSRSNPLAGIRLREIEVVISTGKTLRILTNDLDSPAGDIAELYKARWQIELFFRWVKQNLQIRRFLGTSENAVRLQIAIALIAFLLLHMAHAAQAGAMELLQFTRLVRANLMHRRALHQLLRQPPRTPPDHRQMELALA